MKKVFALCLAALVSGAWFSGTVFAQEDGAEWEQHPPAAIPEGGIAPAMGVNMGPLGVGTLSIDGFMLVGARARGAYQEDAAFDGNWALEGLNPTWGRNLAELYINYRLSGYGAFIGLRADQWGPNAFDYGIPPFGAMIRYAFAYIDTGKFKISAGMLYDELLPVPGSRIWKSTGPGDSHRFTDEDNYPVRLEFKPIEGLNVGAQLFFPQLAHEVFAFRTDGRDGVNGFYNKGLDDTDAWKEIGIGAQYSNSMFDAQAGVRFDSEVDYYNKFDTGPQGQGNYLNAYYGQASLLQNPLAVDGWNYPAASLGNTGTPRYKHWSKLVDSTFDMTSMSFNNTPLPYGDAHYAFFGFTFKGIPNFTARAHGGLYNLGNFDEFGYGRFSGDFNLQKIAGTKLSAGLTWQAEFYGSDVFDDQLVNSPYIKFGPQLYYDIITSPYMPLPILKGGIETEFGFCKDVLDIYCRIKPVFNVSLGVMMIDIFYEMEYFGYKDGLQTTASSADTASLIDVKPLTTHTVGISFMLLF